MEAEIERADCRDMVRDITFASLPTRKTFIGRGVPNVTVGNEAPSSYERAPTGSSLGGGVTEEDEDGTSSKEASPVRAMQAGARRKSPPAELTTTPPAELTTTRPPAELIEVKAARSPALTAARDSVRAGREERVVDEETHEALRLAMQAAIAADRADMLAELLSGSEDEPPADPNGYLRTGKTFLSLASAGGKVRAATVLLAHGADPNRMDANGDHPLHLASARDKTEIVRVLLEAGAEPEIIDGNGETPFQLATSDAMRKLLQGSAAGARYGAGASVGAGRGGKRGSGAVHVHSSELFTNSRESEGDEDEGEEDEGEEDDERATGILTNADGNVAASGKGGAPTKGGSRGGGSGGANGGGTATATAAHYDGGPPPTPAHALGDAAVLPTKMLRPTLLAQLQALLHTRETDMKRLLVLPHGLPHEVQLDVLRVGKSNNYRCYLRLGSRSDRRICIFEASRTRKGSLKNSQYVIKLPRDDPRLVDVEENLGYLPEDLFYCGKVRSYNLSGANFVAYDDGVKVETPDEKPPPGKRLRRQMVAMCFNKSSSRRVPMTMRVLVPAVEVADAPDQPSERGVPSLPQTCVELLETLQALPQGAEEQTPPAGTRLLKLVPPRWNADEQMFQLFCEGRACCMSNKNVQLADTLVPNEAVLQVGKLNSQMFNVDLQGCLSPFQAFCSALAVFDQSSVRRRF